MLRCREWARSAAGRSSVTALTLALAESSSACPRARCESGRDGRRRRDTTVGGAATLIWSWASQRWAVGHATPRRAFGRHPHCGRLRARSRESRMTVFPGVQLEQDSLSGRVQTTRIVNAVSAANTNVVKGTTLAHRHVWQNGAVARTDGHAPGVVGARATPTRILTTAISENCGAKCRTCGKQLLAS
jgi:hypothetical protein